MTQEVLRQRIKYLMEEGGLCPDDLKAATKPLLCRLVAVVVAFEIVNLLAILATTVLIIRAY